MMNEKTDGTKTLGNQTDGYDRGKAEIILEAKRDPAGKNLEKNGKRPGRADFVKKTAFWAAIAAILIYAGTAIVRIHNNRAVSVDDELKEFIDCCVSEHYRTGGTGNIFRCTDWKVVGTEKGMSETTVYMWVLYEEYSNGGRLREESASHILTAITAEKRNGEYTLLEYWEPRDGAYYSDDVRSRVPWYLRKRAFDSQRYVREQTESCEKKARDFFVGEKIIVDDPLIAYIENSDGTFTAENGINYKYIFRLTGRAPNALCDMWYIVLTNNKELTFERVLEGLITSQFEKRLDENETVILSTGLEKPNADVDFTYAVASSSTAWANYAAGNEIYMLSLNNGKLLLSSVRHLPVYIFSRTEGIENFKNLVEDQVDFSQGYDEIPSFDQAVEGLGENFFDNHTLLVVYVASGSGSERFCVNDITVSGWEICIHVRQKDAPESVSCDMAGWWLLVPVSNDDISGYLTFDAIMD